MPVKQDFVGKFGVSFLLTRFFVEFGKSFAGRLLGGFFCRHADGATGLQIHKSGRDFAPVAKFQRALAKPAVGHHRNGIGDAAVNLHVGHQALAPALGVVDAQFAQAQHGQAYAENLARAQMAVGFPRQFKIFGERFHVNLGLLFILFLNTVRSRDSSEPGFDG